MVPWGLRFVCQNYLISFLELDLCVKIILFELQNFLKTSNPYTGNKYGNLYAC